MDRILLERGFDHDVVSAGESWRFSQVEKSNRYRDTFSMHGGEEAGC